MPLRRSPLSLHRLPLLPVLALGCLLSCARQLELAEPLVRGTITRVEETGRGLRILVEERPGVEDPSTPGGAKYWFTIRPETEILVSASDGSRRSGDGSALRLGALVAAWASGPIAESYPAQAEAARVVVLKEGAAAL